MFHTDPHEDADRNVCPNPTGRDFTDLLHSARVSLAELSHQREDLDHDGRVALVVEELSEGWELSSDAANRLRAALCVVLS
jgi:hypothetical protein